MIGTNASMEYTIGTKRGYRATTAVLVSEGDTLAGENDLASFPRENTNAPRTRSSGANRKNAF